MVASGTESEGFTLIRTKLSSSGRQVVIAMILVGMIIGSAIATTVLSFADAPEGLRLFLFRLSYLGFVTAMIVAILIVLRLLWRWIRGDKPAGD